jgi:II/X family phage/plasmid replication protein
MGLDTVKFRSPKIHDDLACFLEHQCVEKSAVHLGSGELLYEFTSGELLGSWDSRISFRVLREEWVSNGKGIQQIDCDPYIEVEASLHKFFGGQNIYGAPVHFQFTSVMFLKQIFKMLGVNVSDHHQDHKNSARLPGFLDWQVCRIDWAEVYQLTPAAITEFFRSISHCKFPRRSAKSAKYGLNAVYFPGSFTTLKLYHKGPEFKEHDKLRIKNALMTRIREILDNSTEDYRALSQKLYQWRDKKLAALQRLADNRLRVECEIHADKLQHDFEHLGRLPKISEVTDDYIKNIHDREVFKLLREGKSDMETVRTYDKVKARLNALHTTRTANALFAFYTQMSIRGEDVTRHEYSDSQFYANRKKLVDSGVSWLASDIYLVPQSTALPDGFAPVRSDLRLCITPIRRRSVFFIPQEHDYMPLAA